MTSHAEKSSQTQKADTSPPSYRGESVYPETFQFKNKRPENAVHSGLQALANKNTRVNRFAELQSKANGNSEPDQAVQRKEDLKSVDPLKTGSEFLVNSSLDEVKMNYISRSVSSVVQRRQHLAHSVRPAQKLTDLDLLGVSNQFPVQLMPDVKAISVADEKAIKAGMLVSSATGLALLLATPYVAGKMVASVRKVYMDAGVNAAHGMAISATDKLYSGIAGNKPADWPAGKTFDIVLNPALAVDLPFLTSTIIHELKHVEQHSQGQSDAKSISVDPAVYGAYGETSNKIMEAQEIETHLLELNISAETGISKAQIVNRAQTLCNLWQNINVTKASAKTARQKAYIAKLLPMIRQKATELDTAKIFALNNWGRYI